MDVANENPHELSYKHLYLHFKKVNVFIHDSLYKINIYGGTTIH